MFWITLSLLLLADEITVAVSLKAPFISSLLFFFFLCLFGSRNWTESDYVLYGRITVCTLVQYWIAVVMWGKLNTNDWKETNLVWQRAQWRQDMQNSWIISTLPNSITLSHSSHQNSHCTSFGFLFVDVKEIERTERNRENKKNGCQNQLQFVGNFCFSTHPSLLVIMIVIKSTGSPHVACVTD